MKKSIAKIEKSQREELRVALNEFRARDGTVHQMIAATVFYDDGAEYRPGRNGLNVKIDLLPALVEALQGAEREARGAGLLRGD